MDSNTSNRLALLRDRILENIKLDEDWPVRTHQLCLDLVEVRDRFVNDAEFGRWLDEGGVRLSHQDRAAAITMGRRPEDLLDLLKKTDRRSLRHIYANEWGFTRVGKPPAAPAKPARQAKTAPSLEKALHTLGRMKAAGETITREAIVKEAGVGEGTAQKAMAMDSIKPVAPEVVLSMSAQEKFEARVRAFEKDFDFKVETQARELHRKWREENSLPHYFAKLEEVENLLNSPRWAVMPPEHFRLILACLHPDNAREGHEKRFEEAFAIFNGYKPKLVDLSAEKEEKDRRKRIEARGAPLPRTVEEMLARKKSR